MDRRTFLLTTGGLAAMAAAGGAIAGHRYADRQFDKIDKADSDWRGLLSDGQFHVMFEDGTEPPGSSPLNGEKRDGSYLCAACFLPLFSAQWKYDSGTGWPSFYRSIDGHTGTSRDWRLLVPRTEYHCARCGAHQGHVFDDGPPPTGKRWCNNGVALRFVPADEPLPALRS